MAHVLGTVGILAAFGAGAHEDAGSEQMDPYASEKLDGMTTINATPMGTIVMDVKLDTLLEGDHYLVLDFGDAQLKAALAPTFTPTPGREAVQGVAGDATSEPVVAEVQPEPVPGSGFYFYTSTMSTTTTAAVGTTPGVSGTPGAINPVTVLLERAFNGDPTDSSAVYKMGDNDDLDLEIATHIRLDLGGMLEVSSAGSYSVDVYIYDSLGEARAAARGTPSNNYAFEASADLFSVESSLASAEAEITAHLAVADVAHHDGPFLGFDASTQIVGNMSSMDVGVLATIELTPDDFADFLDPADGDPLTSATLTGADVTVTAPAGAFGFGVGAGRGPNGEVEIKGDDPLTEDVVETGDDEVVLNAGGAPTAFMISTSTDCGNNPLKLSNADGDAVDPNAETDAVYSADATTGKATMGTGTGYFCVLTAKDRGTADLKTNDVAIKAVGDIRMLDGYAIALTTKAGTASGPSEMGSGGSIDRNGTTLNISYLSLHPAYNQRLVIVNRGDTEADFWMDTFQTEEGTEIMNELRGKVPGNSRTVIRVQDALQVRAGSRSRASGTMNLTAPERNIDVMTIQENLGTGQLDTTIYQHTQ